MKLLALLLVALMAPAAPPAPPKPKPTPTPSAPQAPLKVRSRKERMDRYLISSMRRSGVDAWLVVTREGTTDPVAFDVAADHAVGRAACLFVDKGDHLERVAVVAATPSPSRSRGSTRAWFRTARRERGRP